MKGQKSTQRFIHPRPNITSYQVCMEDGGGNGGKSGFRQRTIKYYQLWKFGDGKFKPLGRVLPKTTILKIKLVYSAHSIPFCAYNELLKGFFDWISRSVRPLMINVFGNYEKYKYQIRAVASSRISGDLPNSGVFRKQHRKQHRISVLF